MRVSGRKRKSLSGSGMLEYALPGILIVGSALIPLQSPEFTANLKHYIQAGNNGVLQGSHLAVNTLGQGITLETASGNAALQGGSVTGGQSRAIIQQTVCLKSGVCVSVPKAVGGGLNSETTGVMGDQVAEATVNMLNQLVNQLQVKNADPALIALVSNLASSAQNVSQGMSGANGIPNTTGSNTAMFLQARQALENYLGANPSSYSDLSQLINTQSNQFLAASQNNNSLLSGNSGGGSATNAPTSGSSGSTLASAGSSGGSGYNSGSSGSSGGGGYNSGSSGSSGGGGYNSGSSGSSGGGGYNSGSSGSSGGGGYNSGSSGSSGGGGYNSGSSYNAGSSSTGSGNCKTTSSSSSSSYSSGGSSSSSMSSSSTTICSSSGP